MTSPGAHALDDAPPSTIRAGGTERRRAGFGLALGLIVALAVVVRIVYVVRFAPSHRIFPDSFWYYQQAHNLRAGDGYIDIARQLGAFNGHPAVAGLRPTAYWPPLFPGVLAIWQALVGDSVRTSQLVGSVTGALTVLLVGLLGRAVAGRTVGLVAATLTALSPFVIAVDGSLMSETLYLPLVLLALLFAFRAREHPTMWSWILLGGAIGLASLTRGDALFLVVVAMVPAAVLARGSWTTALFRLAIGLGALALVIAPWVVRNAIEVGEPTLSTVSASGVIAVSNCDAAYHGRLLGSWSYACMEPKLGFRMSEVRYSRRERQRGIDYALGHASRWPIVGAARVARVWGFWDPRVLTANEAVETRNRSWQRLAWPVSMATLAVGLAGFWILARRGRHIAVLVAPVVMTTLVALVTYGNTRFRTAAEPVLLIGVAVVLTAAAERWRTRRDRGHPASQALHPSA